MSSVLAARTSATTALASAAASRTSTAATAAFAGNHGTGFVDHECAAHQVAAIASLNRAVSGGVVIDLNEPESASLAGETIAHYVHAIDGHARLREEIR
jgi:hypothetical protein